MDDLFRFVALRAAQASDASLTVSLAQTTALQQALADIRAAGYELPAAKIAAFLSEAKKYQAGTGSYAGRFVSDPTALTYFAQVSKVRNDVLATPTTLNLAGLLTLIANAFSITTAAVPTLVASTDFKDQTSRVLDSMVATFISPVGYQGLLRTLSEISQAVRLIQRAAANDARLSALAPISAALSATLVLPGLIFPFFQELIQPVGIADLLVVKQRIKRYELGEVSTVENILKGETRRRSDKHSLTRDVTTVEESETTTETSTDLNTVDRFELKQETEKTLQEDLSISAGVNISAKYGAVNVDARTDVAYNSSKLESSRQAQTQARDVTLRAASKVTERVRRQLTTRVIETVERQDERTFDNSKGPDNVSGVYQFVNKVYEAQVFNYGKRLLFDFMVPEPAAFLLDSGRVQDADSTPIKPPPFTLGPSAIDWANPNAANGYSTLAGLYGAAYTAAPDAAAIAIEHSFSDKIDSDGANDNLHAHTDIKIPEHYVATSCKVTAGYNKKDFEENSLGVIIGNNGFGWNKAQADARETRQGPLNHAQIVGVAISTAKVKDYVVNVSIICTLQSDAMESWRLATYSSILAAYTQRVKEYEDKVAARKIEADEKPTVGSSNPEINRKIEREELKKSSIALISKQDLLDFNGITDDAPTSTNPGEFPRPAGVATVVEQGRLIRFFEQAFEWQQMTYVFYPYFWGRKSTWYDKVKLEAADPLFENFLAAGEARVVVPVRPGFEADIRYYLLTGQPWLGADLPSLTDSNYLPITDEIKELTASTDDAIPQGKSWDVRIPTELIRVRADGKLPEWIRASPSGWDWTEKP